MQLEPIPYLFSPSAPTKLGLNAKAACLALDQRALGGFWSEKQWQEELERQANICIGYWSTPGAETLLGLICGWVVADEIQISMVAVEPSKRRLGLGTKLLHNLLARAKEQGCLRASLEVSEANQAAIGLYEGVGFSTCGIRNNYYRNGDNALIKIKDLYET
jgi:ribosomal-protein-alanine N-acetyltransferase